jgi:hypothetical protein
MRLGVFGGPMSKTSFPRKREPSTPQRFGSIANACVYWIPAFAGTTPVRGGASRDLNAKML